MDATLVVGRRTRIEDERAVHGVREGIRTLESLPLAWEDDGPVTQDIHALEAGVNPCAVMRTLWDLAVEKPADRARILLRNTLARG